MAAFQNPSETSKGKVEEFYLQLARGYISNHTHIHKFGSVPEMANGTTGTIWDINDTLYPWSTLDTPAVVNVNRANSVDPLYNGELLGSIGGEYSVKSLKYLLDTRGTSWDMRLVCEYRDPEDFVDNVVIDESSPQNT